MADENDSARLNKFIARQTGISRREADELIEQGRVKINGEAVSLGMRVLPTDAVSIDDKHIEPSSEVITLLLNKPAGYVSSRRQQGDSPTLYSLLPEQYHSLKTVGRLDRESSGLILLSNDGDFSHQMTHPSFYKVKVYEVTLDSPLQPLHRQMIADYGVMLEDGKSQFGLERLADGDDYRWRVTMSEGRNRQIRRTFGALGYMVTALHRVSFGPYTIDDIQPGEFKLIDIS